MIRTAQKTYFQHIKFWAVFLCLALTLSACRDEVVSTNLYPLTIELKSSGTKLDLTVERAATRKEQEVGLMNRESMPDKHGMIFVYPAPQLVYFWMKNTLIPLDMVFIDSNDVVVHIHKGAKPHDLTPISSGALVRSAVELNAGSVDKFGIAVGDKVIFTDYN